MSNYRKLIVAVVGVLLMLANQHFGVDLTGMEPAIIDAIGTGIAALAAFGVWAAPNTPSRI